MVITSNKYLAETNSFLISIFYVKPSSGQKIAITIFPFVKPNA